MLQCFPGIEGVPAGLYSNPATGSALRNPDTEVKAWLWLMTSPWTLGKSLVKDGKCLDRCWW